MSWYTLEEAETLGPSADAWLQRVRAEEVSSYVDGRNQRWVWVDAGSQTTSAWGRERELVPLWKDVASLRREVKNLYARRAQVQPMPQLPLALRLVEPEPIAEAEPIAETFAEPKITIHRSERVRRPAPTPSTSGASNTILALVAERWTGSDRELERRANLPKAFLAKAKKGLRNGPRSAQSWARLEAFIQQQQRAAA